MWDLLFKQDNPTLSFKLVCRVNIVFSAVSNALPLRGFMRCLVIISCLYILVDDELVYIYIYIYVYVITFGNFSRTRLVVYSLFSLTATSGQEVPG